MDGAGKGIVLRLVVSSGCQALERVRNGKRCATAHEQGYLVGMAGWIKASPLEVAALVPTYHSIRASGMVQGITEAMEAAATGGKDASGACGDGRQVVDGTR
jgi:hypothetical protein